MNNTMFQLMSKTVKGYDKKSTHLKFSNGNAKLDGISILSLPAGHACPFAKECHSRTVIVPKNPCGFGIQDFPTTKFRCFAATDEAKYPPTRNARWFNFLALKSQKTKEGIISLIEKSLPSNPFAPIRIHVSGDFFSQLYFDAWLEVAKNNPSKIFYAYTKALPFWVKRLNSIPSNFRLTASKGGTHDRLIEKHKLRSAIVVFSVEEAIKLGLEIDHDDSHAYGSGGNFALLLHGTQPAGTIAAKAWSALKHLGIGGYSTQKEKRVQIKTGAGSPNTPSPYRGKQIRIAA